MSDHSKKEIRERALKLLLDLLQDFALKNLFARPGDSVQGGFSYFIDELLRRSKIVHPDDKRSEIARKAFALLLTVERKKFFVTEATLDGYIIRLTEYVKDLKAKESVDVLYYRSARNTLRAMKENMFSSSSPTIVRKSKSGNEVRFNLDERSPGPGYSGEQIRSQFLCALISEDTKAINALAERIAFE